MFKITTITLKDIRYIRPTTLELLAKYGDINTAENTYIGDGISVTRNSNNDAYILELESGVYVELDDKFIDSVIIREEE